MRWHCLSGYEEELKEDRRKGKRGRSYKEALSLHKMLKDDLDKKKVTSGQVAVSCGSYCESSLSELHIKMVPGLRVPLFVTSFRALRDTISSARDFDTRKKKRFSRLSSASRVVSRGTIHTCNLPLPSLSFFLQTRVAEEVE